MRVGLCGHRGLFADAIDSYLRNRGHEIAWIHLLPADLVGAPEECDVVLLLDPHPDWRTWVTAMRDMRAPSPHKRVLLLTSSSRFDIDVLALVEDVDGVRICNAGLNDLDRALTGAPRRGAVSWSSGGQRWTPADVLSPRERDVIALLVQGEPTSGIARALGVSTHTVHAHVQAILRKLGARDRVEAVSRFLSANDALDLG